MGKACGWLVVAGCVLLTASAAHGQRFVAPPPPVPVLPTEDHVTLDTPPPVTHPPARQPPIPYFSEGDPLLERPELPPPGWFVGVEAEWNIPHVKNRLTNSVLIDGTLLDTVHVPQAELDSTVAPRFELGYRLPDGFGEFVFSYRLLVSEGTNIFNESSGFARVKSRLALNVFDFDYANYECSLAPDCEMRWKVGVRVAGVYFDSRSDLLTLPVMLAALNLDQHTSNNFWGGGPHAGLQLTKKLGVRGLTAFANLEGATVLGQIRQGFSERFTFLGVPNTQFGGATTITRSQAAPTLSIQCGLGWSPPGCERIHYSVGYQYEHWWSLGKVDASSAELWDQGLFLRAEYNF
jgi:hypothetical protein